MNRRGLLLALLGVGICALLVAWWLVTFEQVEEDVQAPLRGEARYNPLFGLKKALQAHGFEVESRANLNQKAMALGDEDTVILAADVRTLGGPQASELLDWVDNGGHLLFALPHGKQGRAGELLDALDLTVVPHFTCVSWPAGDAIAPAAPGADSAKATAATDAKTADNAKDNKSDTDAEHCFSFAFKAPKAKLKDFSLLEGDKDNGFYLGRRDRGDGDWTAAGNLSFLYTEALKRPGYAAFAWQVLAPLLHKGAKVHLIYAADVPPLHVLLVRYGWPALLPAVLALLAWLWARSQRLGPLLAVASAHRRALREHIQAAGEFTFRRRRAAALYAPVRRAFDERLRRDDPALAALEGDTLIDALAARSGYSRALVRQALMPFDLAEPEQFYVTIKTLTELRARP